MHLCESASLVVLTEVHVHSTAGLLWGTSEIQIIARPLLWGEYLSGLEKHTK